MRGSKQGSIGSRWISQSALALVVTLAFGCSTTPMPPPEVGMLEPYRVGAPDMLEISILPEPASEFSVTVRPDGVITIPLVGEVAVGGRTIPEISRDIEERMGRFKRGAVVTVSLVGAASTDITIMGEVNGTSSFPLVKATRIAEAIGQVGGVTNLASAGKIRVIRSKAGQTVVHRVDLKAIRKGDLSTNMLLEPGDIVYVPPTFMARIGYVIQSILFPFQPILGTAQTLGGQALLF
jgi:polysaccharide export outer membrane protein